MHGAAPVASAFTAQYADAATVLLNAVDSVAQDRTDGRSSSTRRRCERQCSQTRLLDGISGDVAFDANGDRIGEGGDLAEQAKDLGLAACLVQNGKLVNLFP